MSNLRWSLLIIGGLLLLGIYLYGRWRGQTRPSDIFDDMGEADNDILLGKRGDADLREKLGGLKQAKQSQLFADLGGEPEGEIKIGLKPSDMRGGLKPLADQPAVKPVILRKHGIEDNTDTSVKISSPAPKPEPATPKIVVDESKSVDEAQPEPEEVIIEEAPETENRPLTEDEHIVVMHIVAPKGKPFAGKAVLKVFHANGLRYGAMNIFHRITKREGESHTVFSIASMVKPGTLDPKEVVTQQYQGLSLFARLPSAVGNIAAYDEMLHCAQHMTSSLGGELRDQKLRPMTHGAIMMQRGNLRKRFPEQK